MRRPDATSNHKSVGIWIRVSTEDQARGESAEHHERRACYYAESKGWQVAEVYHLEAVSGKSVMGHPETKRMLEHIAVHRYFMGLDFQRDIGEAEGVEHWYDTVYQPVVAVIHESGLMTVFPGKTEADFYLWVVDHRHYLVAQGKADLVEPGQVAEEFVAKYWKDEIPASQT